MHIDDMINWLEYEEEYKRLETKRKYEQLSTSNESFDPIETFNYKDYIGNGTLPNPNILPKIWTDPQWRLDNGYEPIYDCDIGVNTFVDLN